MITTFLLWFLYFYLIGFLILFPIMILDLRNDEDINGDEMYSDIKGKLLLFLIAFISSLFSWYALISWLEEKHTNSKSYKLKKRKW